MEKKQQSSGKSESIEKVENGITIAKVLAAIGGAIFLIVKSINKRN